MLRNSGLSFPFSSQEDLQVKGFGGTRNCDWWFSDKAVLLDTAGRYTTDEDDREEWFAFLALLKKYRPKLPINGILVTMSLVDLLTSDEQGIEWHVKIIRERIEELYNQLGYVFPVYIVLTKVDLLKGFEEFFGELNEKDRKQVLGVNLLKITNEENKIEGFEKKLYELYGNLMRARFHKLSLERNLMRKLVMFDFPEQFKASLTRLDQFVRLLAKADPYHEPLHFCGVYFTSGTQEGTPIQRILGNLSQAFGYLENVEKEPQEQITKSYFIRDLFNEIIFQYRDEALRSRHILLTTRWLKPASVVGGLAMIALTFTLYSASLTTNTLWLKKGANISKQLAASVQKPNESTNELMGSLNKAFGFYQSLIAYKQSIPWHLRLGLYRGDREIAPYQTMLNNLLNQLFLAPTGKLLEKELAHNNQRWSKEPRKHEQLRGDYYNALRSYLMLAFPARSDSQQISEYLSTKWQKALIETDSADQYLLEEIETGKMVQYYLLQLQLNQPEHQQATPLSINPSLVKKSRQQLYSPTNAKNLYALIHSRGISEHQSLPLIVPDPFEWLSALVNNNLWN